MSYNSDTLRLEKGMYEHGNKTFTQVLEEQDPSDHYIGTPLEGLDAFQRQLKRFDIKVRGDQSDTVEKFFRTSDSSVLFPEFIARAVKTGMEESGLPSSIVATSSSIKAENILEKNTGGRAGLLKKILSSKGEPIVLHKRGRMLVAPYESIKKQKLDALYIIMKQIGRHIANMHLEDAVEALLKNSSGGSPVVCAGSRMLRLTDMLDFLISIGTYQMNTVIVDNITFYNLMQRSDIRSLMNNSCPLCGVGQVPNIIRASSVPSKVIIGLDKNYALEQVISSNLLIDYDRLIDRKFERSTIASIAGYSKLIDDAVSILKICGKIHLSYEREREPDMTREIEREEHQVDEKNERDYIPSQVRETEERQRRHRGFDRSR